MVATLATCSFPRKRVCWFKFEDAFIKKTSNLHGSGVGIVMVRSSIAICGGRGSSLHAPGRRVWGRRDLAR